MEMMANCILIRECGLFSERRKERKNVLCEKAE